MVLIEDCEHDDQDPGSWLEDEIEAKSKIALVDNTYLNKTSKILWMWNQIVLSIFVVWWNKSYYNDSFCKNLNITKENKTIVCIQKTKHEKNLNRHTQKKNQNRCMSCPVMLLLSVTSCFNSYLLKQDFLDDKLNHSKNAGYTFLIYDT